MVQDNKQELLKRTLTMLCMECGNREQEHVLLNETEFINGQTITIPNVPTIRCKHCGALAYTPDAMKYMDQYRNSLSL